MSAIDFDKLLYQAKLAHNANLPQKTFKLMETIIKNKKEDLTAEERNLFALSFKHSISAIRASLNKCNELLSSEETKDSTSASCSLIKSLKTNIEIELKDSCKLMIDLLEYHLIKNATSPDSKVFYYKLKGDYYRYLATFFTDNEYSQNALLAYKQATQFSDGLSFINPIKIDLALSFSVFYYDVLKEHDEAIGIASDALNEGLELLEKIEESDMKEATASLQMLKDNIEFWTKDNKEQDNADDI